MCGETRPCVRPVFGINKHNSLQDTPNTRFQASARTAATFIALPETWIAALLRRNVGQAFPFVEGLDLGVTCVSMVVHLATNVFFKLFVVLLYSILYSINFLMSE